MAIPNSEEDISKLGGGEGFWKSTRSWAWYQSWSPPKNNKAHHANTWDLIGPIGSVEPHFWEM